MEAVLWNRHVWMPEELGQLVERWIRVTFKVHMVTISAHPQTNATKLMWLHIGDG